jgi:hypothetical protein
MGGVNLSLKSNQRTFVAIASSLSLEAFSSSLVAPSRAIQFS